MNSKKKLQNNPYEDAASQKLASELESLLREKPSSPKLVAPSELPNSFPGLGFQPFQIEKYQILERIATGGMAEVYRAKLIGVENFVKHVAIKRILPEHLTDQNSQRLFITEAKVSSQLIHPNIVQTNDFIQNDKELLLIMEYVSGRTLRQIQLQLSQTGNSLPIPIALHICAEIAQGLHYAHTRKDSNGEIAPIIHRDISPQNVMISFDGNVKILDFGIAKSNDSIAQKTKTGFIKGKLTYMAPEQAQGKEMSPRSDIYATALVLFELLSGQKARNGESDMEVLMLAQNGIIPPIEIPDEVKAVVMKALELNPGNRQSTAEKFSVELRNIISKLYSGFDGSSLAQFMEKHFKDALQAERLKLDSPIDSSSVSNQNREKGVLLPFHEFSKVGFLSNDSKNPPLQLPNENTFVKSYSDLELQLVKHETPPPNESVHTQPEVTETEETEPLVSEVQTIAEKPKSKWIFHLGAALCFLFGLSMGAKFLLKNNKTPPFATTRALKPKDHSTVHSEPQAPPSTPNQARILALAVGDPDGSVFRLDWNDAFSKRGSISPCEKAESLCKPSTISGKAPYTINIRPVKISSGSLWNKSNCETLSPNASFDIQTLTCRFSISDGDTTIRFFK